MGLQCVTDIKRSCRKSKNERLKSVFRKVHLMLRMSNDQKKTMETVRR